MTEQLFGHGMFEQKPFPALLAEIRDSGKTGILLAKKEEVEKRIFFQNGEPVASRSNNRRELIGEILCARRKISRDQLDEAVLESKKKSGDNFGQILVKKGFLTPKDLYSECKYQFISVLFSIFSWDSGTFAFQEEEASTLIPADLPRFHVKFSKLLSEGIRVIKDESFMDRLLGDTEQVVRPTSVSIPSRDLSFKGEDRTVLEALGGGKTVQELIDGLGLDPFLIKKILFTLSCLGAVEIRTAVPEGEEPEAPLEAEEELPALSESSLSAFMTDIMPEKKAEELPVFEEETESAPGGEVIAGNMGEEDEVLWMSGGGEREEEVPEAPEKMESGMEDQPFTEAPGEDKAEALLEDELSMPEAEKPAEEEAVVLTPREEGFAAGAAEEEEELPVHVQEEVSAGGIEEKTEERALTEEQERLSAPGEKKAERERIKRKKKKGFSLPAVAAGVVVLLAVLALYYFPKFKESKSLLVAGGGQEQPVGGEEEVTKPAEAPKAVEQEEATEMTGEVHPMEPEKAETQAVVTGPEEAAPAPEGPVAADQISTQAEGVAPGREAVAPEKEETAPPHAPAPPWKDAYARGLENFKEGNLKSAFREWSDVIRVAPDHAYTIQIEISSYLNFASKDIKEASSEEKVFIVPVLLENKSLYRVLCGVYADRSEAEAALKGLTPYLKAQKPALVNMDRLKEKLAD